MRLDCYGTVDELNSFIGHLLNQLQAQKIQPPQDFLFHIQNQLFNMGSLLACSDKDMLEHLPPITSDHIEAIEKQIDELDSTLTPLKQFILPGGSTPSSLAHVCRTLCRRAERHCCKLAELEHLPDHLLPYLNRLSDYFFLLARWCNQELQVQDVAWSK